MERHPGLMGRPDRRMGQTCSKRTGRDRTRNRTVHVAGRGPARAERAWTGGLAVVGSVGAPRARNALRLRRWSRGVEEECRRAKRRHDRDRRTFAGVPRA